MDESIRCGGRHEYVYKIAFRCTIDNMSSSHTVHIYLIIIDWYIAHHMKQWKYIYIYFNWNYLKNIDKVP